MSLSFYLPLLTYPEPTPSERLAAALDLAATLNGRVHATIFEPVLKAPSDPLLNLALEADDIVRAAEEMSRQAGGELASALRVLTRRIGDEVTIERVRTSPLSTSLRAAADARVHDYTLLCLGADPGHAELARDVLFGSGGPAIVLPEIGPAHLSVVGIGWDNSRASARALRDSLPVLKRAGRVILFSASFDKPVDAASVDGALAFLRSHDISAASQTVPPVEARNVADALQDAAIASDCGLLVLGAYGHSRLREFVLGGVTRSILASRRLAVLLSH